MANEQLQSAVAANRDVPTDKPGPFQDCSDVVHISVFFDGTGNNREKDNASKKWSNVARMFDSALELQNPSKGTYTVYISGVGTPYNGKAVKWLSGAGVWVQDNVQGSGFGGGGDRRLDQGDDAVNDRLRDVLIANAKTLGGVLSKYASAGSSKSFAEVNAALGKHRLIKVINLSIFGFSRGAALARAFSNRVIDGCEKSGDDLLYQGYPLRLNFMGLFDTVASFGVPSANVQLPFSERDLTVSSKVERCVHYVAAHEVRFSFPVDLIRQNGKLKDGWIETTYPGVHSDVGGGYEPEAQKICADYSRIPMRDMMRESVMSGVRMLGYDNVRKTRNQLFKQRFEFKLETETAYVSYKAACGALSSTIESQVKQHMKLLYSAYGSMHRAGMQNAGDHSRKDDWYKNIGPHGMAWEIDQYRAAAKAAKWVRVSAPLQAYAQFIKPQEWQIAAWDAKAPAGSMDFVAKFVHDSKVDFIGNLAEPFSYFKPRGIHESTISMWQEGGNWMGNKAAAVGNAVESGYTATKKGVGKAADATAHAANQAYDATAKAANQAYDATADAAKRAADATAKAAHDAAEATKHKAEEAAHYASQTAKQVEDGAQRIFDKGTHWVEQVTKGLATQAGEVVSDAKKVLHGG